MAAHGAGHADGTRGDAAARRRSRCCRGRYRHCRAAMERLGRVAAALRPTDAVASTDESKVVDGLADVIASGRRQHSSTPPPAAAAPVSPTDRLAGPDAYSKWDPEVEGKEYYGEEWRRRNWAGNVQWEQDLLEPQSLAELCDIVKESSFVRVVGRGHSFVPVCKARAAPRSAAISLNKMDRVLDIDCEAMTVTVEGGITYRRLYEVLDAAPESVALANVQSHPGVTVAGTLSTGTHGSAGIDPETGRATLGAQSSLCRSVLMVMDDGTTKRWTRGDADWGAVVVSLGCLGVMAEVTLDLVPDHDFDMVTYTDLSCDHLIKHWRTVANQYQQIQVNGRWWGAPGSAAPPMMWVHLRQKVERGSPPKSKKDYPQTFCGQGQIAEVRRHRASELFGTSEAQMRELQFEYFVPLEHAEAAMQATREVSKDWHLPVETDPEGRPLANYTDV